MDGKDMHTSTRRRGGVSVVLLIVLLIVLAALIILLIPKKEKEVDPHEGQIYINDGFDMVWLTPFEGVEVSDISPDDISFSGVWPEYRGSAYTTRYGVDVSEHQWGIDWDLVSASGVDFAMVRLGYRGCTEGGLFIDPYFDENVRGAAGSGLDVGVYFFSQAISVQEAIQEAELVIDTLSDYDIRMPVVFDWERMDTETPARTDDIDSTVLSDCAVAFCQTIKNAGYDSCIYFNRHFGYYEFDLSRLANHKFWVAMPDSSPDFYYKFDMWQFSFTSEIPGINGEADMNMQFIPVPTPAPQAKS